MQRKRRTFTIIEQPTWFSAILEHPYEVVLMLRETSESEIGITKLKKNHKCLSVCWPVCLSVTCLPVCLLACVLACLFVSLLACLSVCPSAERWLSLLSVAMQKCDMLGYLFTFCFIKHSKRPADFWNLHLLSSSASS